MTVTPTLPPGAAPHRLAEAAGDGRRSLALARELGYPAGEALALERLTVAALFADDLDSARRLARQAQQITADIPGWIARLCSNFLTIVLIESGDLAAAERICAEGLARSEDAGDLWTQVRLLLQMAVLDLRAGRTGDAALAERLPGAGLFWLFREQEDHQDRFRFGREADGSPAGPWGWEDLD